MSKRAMQSVILRPDDETLKLMLQTSAAREQNFLELQEKVRLAASNGLRKVLLWASQDGCMVKRLKQEFAIALQDSGAKDPNATSKRQLYK